MSQWRDNAIVFATKCVCDSTLNGCFSSLTQPLRIVRLCHKSYGSTASQMNQSIHQNHNQLKAIESHYHHFIPQNEFKHNHQRPKFEIRVSFYEKQQECHSKSLCWSVSWMKGTGWGIHSKVITEKQHVNWIKQLLQVVIANRINNRNSASELYHQVIISKYNNKSSSHVWIVLPAGKSIWIVSGRNCNFTTTTSWCNVNFLNHFSRS